MRAAGYDHDCPQPTDSALAENPIGSAADPLADWPNRSALTDPSGHRTLVYSRYQRTDGQPWADGVWVPPDVDLDVAADLAVRSWAGWACSTGDPGLVQSLLARGAIELRHAHQLTHRLTDLPELVLDGFAVMQLDAESLVARSYEIGSAAWSAYPPGHPDHDWADVAAAERSMRQAAAGEVLGPLLPASTVALDPDDAVLGACLVVNRARPLPDGGPWILDVFRAPATPFSGVGSALIRGALEALAECGAPALGLVVTHANKHARQVYERLGFLPVSESWTVTMPTDAG
jgi:ribosomal protein S18 acetylase RimI-like enzyme